MKKTQRIIHVLAGLILWGIIFVTIYGLLEIGLGIVGFAEDWPSGVYEARRQQAFFACALLWVLSVFHSMTA